jgi:hypothetical protein
VVLPLFVAVVWINKAIELSEAKREAKMRGYAFQQQQAEAEAEEAEKPPPPPADFDAEITQLQKEKAIYERNVVLQKEERYRMFHAPPPEDDNLLAGHFSVS